MKTIAFLIMAQSLLSFTCQSQQRISPGSNLAILDALPVILRKDLENPIIPIGLTRQRFPGIHLDQLATAKYICDDDALFANPAIGDSRWSHLLRQGLINFA